MEGHEKSCENFVTLWDFNPSSRMDPNVQRFTGFADIYDQHRPEPPLVIGQVLSQLAGPERPLRVVDVGAGTGLSTRLWRGLEATVIGIEPSRTCGRLARNCRRSIRAKAIFRSKKALRLTQDWRTIGRYRDYFAGTSLDGAWSDVFGDCTHSALARGFRGH